MWTNSCCGHPYPGESREDATTRRLEYELGMSVKNLTLVLPKYIYKTPPYNGIVEHEFCPVYAAVATSEVSPNPKEVKDYTWMEWDDYATELELDANDYERGVENSSANWSWWCKDQLKQLQRSEAFSEFRKTISS